MRFTFAFLLPMLLTLNVAAAADKVAPSTPPVMLGQVVLGLLFVVGIILLLAWVLKKMGHGVGGYSRSMRVIATLPLGTREKAALVQVGDKQILLGVAPGRVNCLHVFDEPVVSQEEAPSGPAAFGANSDFAKKFKEVLKQRTGR
jgi:flagellar protein FliO/FliZ